MNQYFVIFRSQCAAFTPKNSLILIHIFQRLKIHFIYFSSLIEVGRYLKFKTKFKFKTRVSVWLVVSD
jgi:hypothetical protein